MKYDTFFFHSKLIYDIQILENSWTAFCRRILNLSHQLKASDMLNFIQAWSHFLNLFWFCLLNFSWWYLLTHVSDHFNTHILFQDSLFHYKRAVKNWFSHICDWSKHHKCSEWLLRLKNISHKSHSFLYVNLKRQEINL